MTPTDTVPTNTTTPVEPVPDPTPPDTVPANPPTPVDPVPDPTPPITIPANPPTENSPVPDTPPPTHITPTLVADCHGLKWYDSKDVIDLDEVPSLQWNFTNQFGDPVYLEIEIAHRVRWKGNFDIDKNKELDKFAFVWVEKDRRHIISNTSSLKLGLPYTGQA